MAKWPGSNRNKFKGPLSGGRGKGRGRGRRTKPIFRMGIDDFKSYFFDRDDWKDILDPATLSALSLSGLVIMKSARSSMRRRKKSSKPGQTPTVWTGLLKRFIFFGVDDSVKDELGVLIGPAFIKSAHKGVFTITQPTIPATLEFGGTERIKGTPAVAGSLQMGTVSRTISIKPRPYMSKALEAKKERVFEIFHDFLGKSPTAFSVAASKRPSAAA